MEQTATEQGQGESSNSTELGARLSGHSPW